MPFRHISRPITIIIYAIDAGRRHLRFAIFDAADRRLLFDFERTRCRAFRFSPPPPFRRRFAIVFIIFATLIFAIRQLLAADACFLAAFSAVDYYAPPFFAIFRRHCCRCFRRFCRHAFSMLMIAADCRC